MKRHLRSSMAAATTKKVAFTIFCCTVLMLFAAPAWADQCSGAIPIGSATGCGAVITVFTVDDTGNATSFTVTATGNGNPYDGVEDTLVGVQNSSGANLTSITLSSPDTTFGGLFNFDGDGPCTFSTSDCFGVASAGVDPGDYQGPNNTFSGISGDHTSGTVNFTTPIVAGGSTWFALEGTPQSIGGNTRMAPLNPTVTTLTFNPKTMQTINYSNSNLPPSSFSNVTVQETFLTISDAAYSNLVAGTIAQGSKCMPQDITGNGTTFACAGVIVLCQNAPNGSFAGANCPTIPPGTGFITVKEKYLTNAFPTNGSGQVPNPGYLQATDNALSCTNDPSNTCRGVTNMVNITIAEDCCTTSGSPPLHFNSLLIPNYCVGYNVTSVDRNNVVGFAAPVDNPGSGSTPIVNLINAKQAVPLQLTVGALPAPCSGGLPFTNLDLVSSTNPATAHSVVLTVANAPAGTCTGNTATDTNLIPVAAGNSGWQNLGNGVYQFNWKSGAPVGSCLTFSVNLGDGVQHTAYFHVIK